jgi:hypothetical protein
MAHGARGLRRPVIHRVMVLRLWQSSGKREQSARQTPRFPFTIYSFEGSYSSTLCGRISAFETEINVRLK